MRWLIVGGEIRSILEFCFAWVGFLSLGLRLLKKIEIPLHCTLMEIVDPRECVKLGDCSFYSEISC
jgi:hypothetical protein